MRGAAGASRAADRAPSGKTRAVTHEDHPSVWSIVEDSFDPASARSYEGLFTLGSGYLHVRGSVEEHFANAPQNMEYIRDPLTGSGEPFKRAAAHWGTYIPGVY